MVKTMSLNKSMHPRNIYKKAVNFKELAISSPEFRQHAKQDLKGNIHINFKDPAALRALTRAMLLKDFQLDVEIPSDRLVPTLPLRLNYILWIEDLLNTLSTPNESSGIEKSDVYGIDIGTGATCIYPLLAAKKNGWHMTGTEYDAESCSCAVRNVESNNLQHLVTVKMVQLESPLLSEIFDAVPQEQGGTSGDSSSSSSNRPHFDFTMCNPPFFSCPSELDHTFKARSPSLRPPPSNVRTGSLSEVVTEGGEIKFVGEMIIRSREIGTSVKIFTTMLGHKSSVKPVLNALRTAQVTSLTTTEFCQGKTMRWGVAWTYLAGVNLQGALQTKASKSDSVRPPLTFDLCKESGGEDLWVENVFKKLEEIATDLEVTFSPSKTTKYLCVARLAASRNTWSNQRRRRREKQRLDRQSESIVGDTPPPSISDVEMESSEHQSGDNAIDVSPSKRARHGSEDRTDLTGAGGMSDALSRHTTPAKESLVTFDVILRQVMTNIRVELHWVDGTGSRDSLHQIFQHLKNNLK